MSQGNRFSYRWLARVLVLLLVLALPSWVLADNVINDVQAGGNDTFILGDSTIVNYWIGANSGDGQTGCNASDGSAATVDINTPAGVTATPSSLTFIDCGQDAAQPVTFTATATGDHEITVSVSDSGVGTYNTNPGKFTLRVLEPEGPTCWYSLDGFYQPVKSMDDWNKAKGGSTVPLKFRVYEECSDDSSTEITDPSKIAVFVAPIYCPNDTIGDEIETETAGATSLRYDFDDQHFIENWKTPRNSACYGVTVVSATNDISFADDTPSAWFQLK